MYRAALALVLVAAAAIVNAGPTLETRQAPPTCALTVCDFAGNLTLPGALSGVTLHNITLSPDATCAGCAGTTCLPVNETRLAGPLAGVLGNAVFRGNISTCQSTVTPSASAA
ncbi:hypothetical protein PsYK624_103970 [Phanerochaete sordida]|uniref:Hydrophobin n=1 Tax=Phanerochaete sordida TaxID=48140 RepID=A0A9P3GH69_9APHY|nr:hypothetical protein PsYK624_103970 [Phanerochaete sordida]